MKRARPSTARRRLTSPRRHAEVLQAYVCYRPDIGYVQGMSFLAAMLLINLEPYDAFQVLANMLNRGCHMAFFTMDLPRIEGYKAAFDELFAELLPELSRHFREQHVPTDMYLLDWLMTLFSKSLPLELAMRIWDRYFLYGEVFLFRCAFAILHMMKLRLLSQQFDGIAYDLTVRASRRCLMDVNLCTARRQHLPIIYDEDQFFSHVKAVKIPPKRFAAVVSAHVAPRK